MTPRKLNVAFAFFPYGGNGGVSTEVPAIRDWFCRTVQACSQEDRIAWIQWRDFSDTPITMTRNAAVLWARTIGADVLVMTDSDQHPDVLVGKDPSAKPFVPTAFDFIYDHYDRGPVVVGAPYMGPAPDRSVYVFHWKNHRSSGVGNSVDMQLEMYSRETAAMHTGVCPCAALPTGLIMYDMRAFDLTEPYKEGDKPWFYYEWKDHYQSEKASTEDVTATRDMSLAGCVKLGYNPIHVAWDCWAGHYKPELLTKPQVIHPEDVADTLRRAAIENAPRDRRFSQVDFRSNLRGSDTSPLAHQAV